MKLPNLSPIELFRSLRPARPALAFGGAGEGNSAPASPDVQRGGTKLFASGPGGPGGPGGDDDYDGYDDAPYDEEPPTPARRAPGGARGGGGDSGGGRQRTVQFQPEERYWTEYLRIALPIIGLLLMIGLFWYWASQLTDDNDPDEPVGTVPVGTTEIITPPSTPEPTREQIVQSTPPPAETPTEEQDEPESTPDETGDGGDEQPAGTFAEGDFVVVVDGVNMREEGTVEAEIVRELADGEVLEIQSGPVEADDYEWYEVIVEETGEVGWVASEFIEPAEE